MAEFIGNITEPELSYTQNGKAKLEFRLPVDKRKKDGNEWVTVFTSWWGVTLWEEQAEAARDLLKKGSRVLVVGNPIARPYETKTGEKRTSSEIEVEHIGVVIPRKPSTRGQGAPQGQQDSRTGASADEPWSAPQPASQPFADYTDESPF